MLAEFLIRQTWREEPPLGLRHRQENDNKMNHYVTVLQGVVWIHLAQNINHLQVFLFVRASRGRKFSVKLP